MTGPTKPIQSNQKHSPEGDIKKISYKNKAIEVSKDSQRKMDGSSSLIKEKSTFVSEKKGEASEPRIQNFIKVLEPLGFKLDFEMQQSHDPVIYIKKIIQFLHFNMNHSIEKLDASEIQDFLISCFYYLKKFGDPKHESALFILYAAINDKRTLLGSEELFSQMHQYFEEKKEEKIEQARTLFAEIDAIKDPVVTFQDLVERLPVGEQWRLAVDGSYQTDLSHLSQGWTGYEQREKGCIAGILAAHKYALSENIESDLDISCIKQTHALARGGVTNMGGQAGEFYDGSPDFGITPGYTGKHEESDANANGSYLGCYEMFGPHSEFKDLFNSRLLVQSIHPDFPIRIGATGEKAGIVQKILIRFHQQMQELGLEQRFEKLKAVIELIKLLEDAHAFQDGNCRTYPLILLRRELSKIGFPMTLMTNPNQFDLLSTEELMIEVLKGMKELDFLAKKGRYRLDKTPENFTPLHCPFHFDTSDEEKEAAFQLDIYSIQNTEEQEDAIQDEERLRQAPTSLNEMIFSEGSKKELIAEILRNKRKDIIQKIKSLNLSNLDNKEIQIEDINSYLTDLPLQMLDLSNSNLTFDFVSLERNHLKTLKIGNQLLFGMCVYACLLKSPGLEELDISKARFNKEDQGIFHNIMNFANKLELPNAETNLSLPTLPNLRRVNASFVKHLTIEDVQALIEKAPNLEGLNISQTKGISEEDKKALKEKYASERPNLEIIY